MSTRTRTKHARKEPAAQIFVACGAPGSHQVLCLKTQARAWREHPPGPTHMQCKRVMHYIGQSGKCIALAHFTTMSACRHASMREGWMESLLYSVRCACA